MRDIAKSEHICFDYGMCETDERLWEPMRCLCGTASCRGWITANDWKIVEMHDKYRGYYSPHVQRLVDKLDAELAAKHQAEVDAKLAAAPSPVPVPVQAPDLAVTPTPEMAADQSKDAAVAVAVSVPVPVVKKAKKKKGAKGALKRAGKKKKGGPRRFRILV